MKLKPDSIICMSTPDFDFSQECPEFRERLKREFLRAAARSDIPPSSDYDLERIHAGEKTRPTKDE